MPSIPRRAPPDATAALRAAHRGPLEPAGAAPGASIDSPLEIDAATGTLPIPVAGRLEALRSADLARGIVAARVALLCCGIVGLLVPRGLLRLLFAFAGHS